VCHNDGIAGSFAHSDAAMRGGWWAFSTSRVPTTLQRRRAVCVMAFVQRIRSADDYKWTPIGLDRTQRYMKMKCALIGMRIFEERHGTDNPWYVHFQTAAIAWASA
jgi:hypothetical protein